MRPVMGMILLIFATSFKVEAFSQSGGKPMIGQLLPDVTFVNVKNYTRKQISIRDFKGKWVIISYYGATCKASIKNLSKFDDYQKKFKKDVKFIMVGAVDKSMNEGTEKLFDHIKKNLQLTISSAFDSIVWRQWEVPGLPHIYILDRQGIVRFITVGEDMTAEKIGKMVNDEQISFRAKISRDSLPDFKPFKNLTPATVLNYSVLTKWAGEKQDGGYEFDRFVTFPKTYLEEGWMYSMAPLYQLYLQAYFGKWWWFSSDSAMYEEVYRLPKIEVIDSTPFNYDYSFDFGRATYNYAMMLPVEKMTEKNMMKQLQETLFNSFGYYISIETREIPIWKLISYPDAEKKLRTKGGKMFQDKENTIAGFTVQNFNIKEFLMLVTSALSNDEHFAFLDYSGINYNIDATIDTDMTDYSCVRNELQKYGLDLVKGTKMMKVLVIKD